MFDARQRLQADLEILEAMAAEMDKYLMSDVLFWPMGKAHMPRLTVGGYLMRQHRLLALRHLLDPSDEKRLEAAVTQFNQALNEKIVRFEERAHQELSARLRQWNEYLRDLRGETGATYYATAVETRAIIAAILDKLRQPPYELDPQLPQRVAALDRKLRDQWQVGDFIWPDEWQPAYPRPEHWWLYGQPRSAQRMAA